MERMLETKFSGGLTRIKIEKFKNRIIIFYKTERFSIKSIRKVNYPWLGQQRLRLED